MASHHTSLSARVCVPASARDRSSSAQTSTSFSSVGRLTSQPRKAFTASPSAKSARTRRGVIVKASGAGGLDPQDGMLHTSQQAWELLQHLPNAMAAALSRYSGSADQSAHQEANRLLQQAAAWMASPSNGSDGQAAVQPVAAAHAALRAASSEALAGSSQSAAHLIHSSDTLLIASILIGVAGCASLIGLRSADGEDEDHAYDLPQVYDPEVLQEYWKTRPVKVAHRAATLAFEVARFAARLRKDSLLGQVEKNRAKRALQLRLLVQKLGPTYIKLAQAFSTRSDLLPSEYISEIEKLQDGVEPFPCEAALAIMAEQLGRDPMTVFEKLSPTPVAAASLGQVYKATLLPIYGSAEVAVKVQRPGVRETVALDLSLLRSMAELLKDVSPSLAGSTDFCGLVDDWGVRFFAEMNFKTEAMNATKFQRQMQERGLDGVVSPRTYWELSSDTLLVTEWVTGQKLNESEDSNVRELCCTLLNCYLIQLLDTGFLHADPHPGNLVVKRDGNLCLLDWGLITEVDTETRITLVEFIAHMQTSDWDRVADDLMSLGFVSPEGGSPREQGLVEPLGNILGQLTRVGGSDGVNIEKVTRDLDELSKQFPYFTIPPYFALILRAFSVIEGIALNVDPSYAIIKECMPYLAQRVLSDDSPRMRELLKQLLYGDSSRLDLVRLQKLSEGFVGYKTSGINNSDTAVIPTSANALRRSPGFDEQSVVDERVKHGLRLILRAGGSFSQEIIINELVNAVDALGREALVELASSLTRSLPGGSRSAASGPLGALSPLSTILLPVLGPVDLMQSPLRRVELSEEDRESLATVRAILALFAEEGSVALTAGPSAGGGRTTVGAEILAMMPAPQVSLRGSVAAGQELLPLLRELAPGLVNVWSEVTIRLLQRTISRLVNSPAR